MSTQDRIIISDMQAPAEVVASAPVGTQKQLFVAPEVTELGRLNKLTKQFGGTFTP